MKISVVIPCRNEGGYIGEFLDSVGQQQLGPDWELEVLVADGMSNDDTRSILADYSRRASNVHMIDNPGRIVSTGLNAAIHAATGDLIIRLDAHTVYAPDYIRECLNALEQTGADNVGGPWVARGRGTIGEAIAAAFQSPFCAGGGKAHQPDFEGEVDTVYLGCWSRSVFDRIGLFDPALVRNQDDELNFRLRRAGGKIWQSPRIRSWYTPRSSVKALFRQYMQYGYWKVAVMRKHGGVAAPRHLAPALFVASLFLLSFMLGGSVLLDWAVAARVAGLALAVELGAYLVASLVATVPFARKLKPLSLVVLPAIIAVHHVAYGLGFLMGLLRGTPSGGEKHASAGAFTALTR